MKELHIIRQDEYIALSCAVSFVGTYCGLTTCEQLRLCSKSNQPKIFTRQLLILFMAVAIGGVSIWCSHFVGMSAISFHDTDGNRMAVYHRFDLTIASLIIAIISSFIGMNICSKDGAFVMDMMDTVNAFVERAKGMTITEIRKMRHKKHVLLLALFRSMQRLMIGTIITAFGMCSMHYLGLMAIVIDANVLIKWDVSLIAASAVIQIIAALFTYWICFRLLVLYPDVEIIRILSSFLIALMVNGMHYVGMTAAKFTIVDGELEGALGTESYLIESDRAAVAAIIASMSFLWVLMFMHTADLRKWFHRRSRTLRNIAAMMDDIEKDTVQTEFSKRILRKYNAINGVKQSPPTGADFNAYFSLFDVNRSEFSSSGVRSLQSRASSFTQVRILSSKMRSTSEHSFDDTVRHKKSLTLATEVDNESNTIINRINRRLSSRTNSQHIIQSQSNTTSTISSNTIIAPNVLIKSKSGSDRQLNLSQNRSTSCPNIKSPNPDAPVCFQSNLSVDCHLSPLSEMEIESQSDVNQTSSILSPRISIISPKTGGSLIPSIRIPRILLSQKIVPSETCPQTPELKTPPCIL